MSNAANDWGRKLLGQGIDMAREAQAVIAKPFEKENSVAVVRPMDAAPDSPPSDNDLNYDPNGPNEWETFWNDPRGGIAAFWHGNRAIQEAKDRFDDEFHASSLQGGEGDAWRHTRWGQHLANSIGAERAKAFMDAHERGEPNPVGSRKMDLVNNRQGRNLQGDSSKATVDNLLYNRYLRDRLY